MKVIRLITMDNFLDAVRQHYIHVETNPITGEVFWFPHPGVMLINGDGVVMRTNLEALAELN